MKQDDAILILTKRDLRWLLLLLIVSLFLLAGPHLSAQKVQDTYEDKFKVATDDGGIAIATSADGRYVYLVGKRGLVVSDDYGKTGTWVQTLRMK